jgi:hypothetical protein
MPFGPLVKGVILHKPSGCELRGYVVRVLPWFAFGAMPSDSKAFSAFAVSLDCGLNPCGLRVGGADKFRDNAKHELAPGEKSKDSASLGDYC